MASEYKTPGVYIEEIPKFPPSIALVETAIPAFVGYTEKADDITPGDLLNKPKKIGSMVEYELFYGYGPSPIISEVKLDDNYNYLSSELTNNFYMYDSLRMFFANGGGDCYIVSVATYKDAAKTKNEFIESNKGINTLEKVDEPTIILFPDAVLLASDDLYDVQKAAMSQCNNLMDRVTILDLMENDPKGATFRDKIGINNLKYGMAYTPWLKVSLTKNIKYTDIKNSLKLGSTSTSLEALTSDDNLKTEVKNVDDAYSDVDTITNQTKTLSNPESTLRERFNSLETTYLTTKNLVNFTNIMTFLYNIARTIDEYIGAGLNKLNYTILKNAVKISVDSNFKSIYNTLISYEEEAKAEMDSYTTQYDINSPSATEWGTIFTAPAAASSIMSGTNDTERMDSIIDNVRLEFEKINKLYLDVIVKSATSYASELDKGLQIKFPIYKAIISGIQRSNTTMPPSGAIAGVYAQVDRTRGVWKAPANVSLNYVIEPTTIFTKTELDALNVDTNAGKSINAIRSFVGKGTLVYGARTLAGNDNEWRYISVRRFFNMVEESVKNACLQFVFEPNDANTWVKVQAMIENLLIKLWRQGALQGAKPEHAFYVAVGLSKTMTSLDILEGRMNIEIGMAVVRPAEFIILKFSQKMAES